jgi:hypothetical protein
MMTTPTLPACVDDAGAVHARGAKNCRPWVKATSTMNVNADLELSLWFR